VTHQLDRKPAPSLEHVRVADAMNAGVVTCAADAPLRDVAWLMVEHQSRCVAVPASEGTGTPPWRLVSDLDLVGAAAADYVEALTANELATGTEVCISDDDRLDRAAELMSEHRVAHLVVLGAASGRPVGILSALDVVAVLGSRASD
jgi:signal-transduction protein with cAMP-binding, CBS, and nucleotidyltransferase domain